MRWSEAGYLSQFVLAHALRQVSVSLILGVRLKSSLQKHKIIMQILKIELQDIADVISMGQIAPHRSAAVDVIKNGGVVIVTRNGTCIGQAKTIGELNQLLP